MCSIHHKRNEHDLDMRVSMKKKIFTWNQMHSWCYIIQTYHWVIRTQMVCPNKPQALECGLAQWWNSPHEFFCHQFQCLAPFLLPGIMSTEINSILHTNRITQIIKLRTNLARYLLLTHVVVKTSPFICGLSSCLATHSMNIPVSSEIIQCRDIDQVFMHNPSARLIDHLSLSS